VAYGLQAQGLNVLMLDERSATLRASLGNFGLVWIQGKGQGAPRYTEWCLRSADLFPRFTEQLQRETGINSDYRKPGGLVLSHGREEYDKRCAVLQRLRNESRDGSYDCEMLERDAVQKLVGSLRLGAGIVGGSYCPHDGYLNPFALLKSLHKSFQQQGGRLLPDAPAVSIEPGESGFVVETPRGRFGADKLVIAAGLASRRLGAMVGIHAPVGPERGQLLVTERVRERLTMPISGIQQTAEGSFIVGLSNEKTGINTDTDSAVIKTMSRRIRNAFPALGRLRVVRSWAALRVLPEDGLPIYHQSESCPGAYVVTSHSGVTFAPMQAGAVAKWIGTDEESEMITPFSARRFNVKATG
jgi:glycine/D-amino acid oxidase-like deaminating enzyme